ncbi:MAG: hypothetical protein NC114_07495 [Ruminococcus flavefaciens]|nr:hypothetical protein [Ruminococcus flavefaciens]
MKSTSLKFVICLAFLILFNALFFGLGGTEHSFSAWSGYAFIHVAYLSLLSTPLLYTRKKGLTVLIAGLYLRALVYFFVQLGLGCLCIAVDFANPVIPIAVQASLFVLFLVLQLMGVLANESTDRSMQKQRQESIKFQMMAQQIKSCMRQIEDAGMKKRVQRCYEALSNCSIECFPETNDIERELAMAVDMLCKVAESQDTSSLPEQADAILRLIQKRNGLVMLLRK